MDGDRAEVYNNVRPVIPPRFRRALAAAAVSAYAVVAVLLLPMHALGEAAPEPTGESGAAFRAACPDRDCHEPGHEHRDGHGHDPASCVSCVQARAAAAPPATAPVFDPSGEALGHAATAAPDAASSAARRVPPARGPPVLLP